MNKLFRSEWIKFKTLRSHWVLLASVFVLGLGMAALAVGFYDAEPDVPREALNNTESLISAILGFSTPVAGILLAVLGVMAMGGEYKSKTVLPSFSAAPIRSEVIAAKGIVLAAVALVTSVLLVAVNVPIGIFWLDQKGFDIDFGADNLLQAAGGSVLYLVVLALFGYGLGLILTNQSLAITLVIIMPLVVDQALAALIPGDWIKQVLPFTAGSALFQPGGTENVEVWQGGAILGLWVSAVVIAGGIVFERRDLGNTG
jgi:ABC-2 type transport system permease protein